MEKRDFYSLTKKELVSLLKVIFNESPFRANQLFQWVYQKNTIDPTKMTNLKKSLRTALKDYFNFHLPSPANTLISEDAIKLLFNFNGALIESVLIKQEGRITLCVSSQYGCAMNCMFCATGKMGLLRNLTTGEIVKQILSASIYAKQYFSPISNIVFMGMGEPLHNINNVINSINIATDDFGLGLSQRKITVSTSGLMQKLIRFNQALPNVNLAISLNASTNSLRNKLMPINQNTPIEKIIDTIKKLPLKKRQKVTLEYIMIKGVNDSKEDLSRLIALTKGLKIKINLIPYNKNSFYQKEPSDAKVLELWQKTFLQNKITATIRYSKGKKINAACGQLSTLYQNNNASI